MHRPLGLIAARSPRGLSRSRRLGLRVAGAGVLAATAAIHLDLYLTGYRTIPAIGWLFLVQVMTAFLLAAAVLALGSRIVAAAGAGFALATLGGYLLSVWAGLFGFTEVRTTAGLPAMDSPAHRPMSVLPASQKLRLPGQRRAREDQMPGPDHRRGVRIAELPGGLRVQHP